MACNVVRLCETEVLCITHKSVFRNDYVALGEHSHNYGGNLPRSSLFAARIPSRECKNILRDIVDAQVGREWRLIRPLQELVLGVRVPPVPQGGEVLEVVVCNHCLANEGEEWIGLEISFPGHRSGRHPNQQVLSTKVMAQAVRLPLTKRFPVVA